MDSIFVMETRKFVMSYLDDIIIYSKDIEAHQNHSRIVLGKIRSSGLSLNKNKCKFFKNEIKILGWIINKGSIKMDETRIKAIKKYPEPINTKALRSFLGTVNYKREFIKNFAKITSSST